MRLAVLEKWVKARLGFPTPSFCVVCAAELTTPDHVRRMHCDLCWPAVWRTLEPPFVKEVRPLGKATGR